MSAKPIYTIATWKVKPGQLDTVMTTLKELQMKSGQEPGNLFYTILQDNQDANTLHLYEGYIDEAALDEHRNSAHYTGLVGDKIRPLLQERSVFLTTPVIFEH